MMSTERTARFTATSALAVAALALGLSVWSVGCRDREPAPEPARTVAVHALPAATAAPIAAAKSVPAVTPVAVATPEPAPERGEVKKHARAPSSMQASGGAFAVKRLVVTRGIDKREPEKTDALRSGDGPLYAFLELANPTDEPQKVEVTFAEDGSSREVGHVVLSVPANKSRWRTWGRTALVDKPGAWTAIVRDASGTELARSPFQIAAR